MSVNHTGAECGECGTYNCSYVCLECLNEKLAQTRQDTLREVGKLVREASVTGDTQVEQFEAIDSLAKSLERGEMPGKEE